MKRKKIFSLLLSLIMLMSLCFGCSETAKGLESTKESNSKAVLPEDIYDLTKDEIVAKIANGDLLKDLSRPITETETALLMENTLRLMGQEDVPAFVEFKNNSTQAEVLRFQLAQLLWKIFVNINYQDENYGHARDSINAAGIVYEVGGFCSEGGILDCSDHTQITELGGDEYFCEYALYAFDRTNGEKLLPIYDDRTFRPAEVMTVGNTIDTFVRFSRSFEELPRYVPVEEMGLHTIDRTLYTGKTTLPDATNQNLLNGVDSMSP